MGIFRFQRRMSRIVEPLKARFKSPPRISPQ
jgi:hypothetical protein